MENDQTVIPSVRKRGGLSYLQKGRYAKCCTCCKEGAHCRTFSKEGGRLFYLQ
ncbi:hypothetical protein DPMN_193198 [Dreissena polymorpha]|uniref:Uncharacterized protein n=1 Tax=Dreissena polymorpha TaxID=45954 RepID=A0A9D3Y252_DREPO|nr:hypothetical protein DPMN_193198 [Dreissena polymorpha]